MKVDYQDHIGLWNDELKDWMPQTLFDGHIHIGVKEAMGEISEARRKIPLMTFSCLPYEEVVGWYENLYQGKTIAGIIACGFPLMEVNIEAANDYIVSLVKKDKRIRGFILANPKNTQQTIDEFKKAEDKGCKFTGVKPYYDLLGKDILRNGIEATIDEFIPVNLLQFMNEQSLPMILHASSIGMGDKKNQDYVKFIAKEFPNIKIMLAHMGRYENVEQFYNFFDSGCLEYANVYLEMSSATEPKVYEKVLKNKDLWTRLMFGSDLPYGLIQGVEYHSKETGPTFITRISYPWSDSEMQVRCADLIKKLTYNTYHTIKALKDAIESLKLSAEDLTMLKQNIFCNNVQGVF